MKFLGMGGFEFVIILIVILVIFGPKNLPKLGNALGKTVSNLRSGMNEGKKKNGDEDSSEEEQAQADVNPAELEGAVETVETVAAAEPVVAAAEPIVEAAEPVVATEPVVAAAEPIVIEAAPAAAAESASDATSAADAPKTVKRVVKKRVVTKDE